MELRTLLREDGIYTATVGDDDDQWHDAAAAHALMRALNEVEAEFASMNDPAQRIKRRAAELMAEWGFTEQAGGE
jgi:hypothetical protein